MRPLFYVVGLLLVLITAIGASPRVEKITRNQYEQNRQLIIGRGKYEYHQNEPQISKNPPQPTRRESTILPLEFRSINDCKLTDLLLVSDIDGNLHGIERNSGTLLWTLPIDDPLVRIQTNNSGVEPNILWFVEPYQDGSLYYFTPKFGLNKLPTSIKDLVLESPFSLSGDDKIYTGTRKTALYSINIRTGEIKSSFGNEDICTIPNTHYKIHQNDHDNINTSQDTIMIGKTTYELSIYSKTNSNTVWNVTYSQWGPNNIDNDLIMQNQQSLDNLYFTQFHDKTFIGINKNLGLPTWKQTLPSYAVSVFDVFNNLKTSEYVILPHPLKVLNDLQVEVDENTTNSDLVLLNRTSNGKEWIAMSFQNYPTLIKSAPFSQYTSELYKLNNGLPSYFETLKKFNLFRKSQSEIDDLVSGIHKVFHLTSETLYQPISRFSYDSYELKKIGDGKNNQAISPQVSDNLETVPNIIGGFKFPGSEHTAGSELMLLGGQNPELQSSFESQDYESQYETKSNFSATLFKRILEDFVVLIVVGMIFMILRKKINWLRNISDKFSSYLNEEKDEVLSESISITDGKVKDFALEIEEKEVAPEALSFEKTVEVSNSDDSSESNVYEKENSKKVKLSPKVTMILPDNTSEVVENETNDHTDEGENTETNEEDGFIEGAPTKKKRKRGSRGGKRGGRKINKNKPETSDSAAKTLDDNDQKDIPEAEDEVMISTKSLVTLKTLTKLPPLKKLQIENNLVISDKVLGRGSHGTVVYEGTFENRPVAVKRMLFDYFDIASHEVRLLQESDDHPNVVRYFCSQTSEAEQFLYIALELGLCTLADMLETTRKPMCNDTLYQLASGLHYLHSLKIVHRDLKPQNILVADRKQRKGSQSTLESTLRLLISDFGLCKKLDNDQSSFRATTHNAALGTSGWRAPELLMNHDLSEISPDTISSINSTSQQDGPPSANSVSSGKRLTKAIDIFSLGCVYYFMLTGGVHPFGDKYMRDGNIIKGEYNIDLILETCPDDKYEATDLISSMISADPSLRPNSKKIMRHPFFWNSGKRLDFLLKISDRFETEKRDPPSPLLQLLESHASTVHQGNWHIKLDSEFMENLGKYRKYHPEKLMDLLRAIRNKYHHYNDMPETLQAKMNPLPDGFYRYFNSKFPKLLMEMYYLVEGNLKQEPIFRDFFE
jgi:serine/threonine-protein kinase/endoribonuclease IRE1